MNAPHCGSCGSQARWLAEQNAWGCDRCRQIVMYAPPPQQQPQPYAQHGFAPPPPAFAPPPPQPQYAPQPPPPQPYAQHGFAPPPPPYAQPQQPPPAPYTPQAQPQPPYSPYPPQPQPAMPPPGPAKKSSKGLVLAIVGVLAIGGGAVAVVLATRGGHGGSRGSRDDVVKDTLTALAAGDADGLLALGDPAALIAKGLDCSNAKHGKDDDDDFTDPDKATAKAKLSLALAAAAAKGTKIELVEIVSKQPPPLDDAATDDKHKDDDTVVFPKGKEVARGCVAKETFRIHEVKTKIRVQEPDRDARPQTKRVTVLELGGRYYLVEPPPLELRGAFARELPVFRDHMCACSDAACAKAVDHDFQREKRHSDSSLPDDAKAIAKDYGACGKKLGIASNDMDAAIDKLGEYADQMCACKDKTCGDRVQADMMKWADSMAKNAKDVKPDDAQTQKLGEISKRLGECMMKLQNLSTPPAPPQQPASGGSPGGAIAAASLDEPPSGMPSACVEYRAQIAKAMTCDKYPPAGRDGLVQAWNQFTKAWNDSPSARQALGDACAQGAKAMRDGLSSLCP